MSRSFSVAQELNKLPVARVQQLTQRLTSLDEEMQRVSPFRLRDDSKLAFLFCDEKLSPFWTRERVIHEMCVMQWICASTPYVGMCQKTLKNMSQELKTRHQLRDWKDVWRILSTYGPDMVRISTMYSTGSQVPDFKPAEAVTGVARDEATSGGSGEGREDSTATARNGGRVLWSDTVDEAEELLGNDEGEEQTDAVDETSTDTEGNE